MASEISVPDHSSACEKIDKEDKLPLPKESEATPKTEEVIATPVVKEVDIPDAKTKVAASEEVAKESVIEPKGVSISEPAVESVECKSDEKAELAKEEKPAEEPAKGVVVASEVKAEKLEEKEVLVPKDAEVSEQPAVLEPTGKEIPVVEAVKVEDSKLPAEEKAAIEETVASISLDQGKSDGPKVTAQEKDVECYPSGVALEKIGEKKDEKEPAVEKTVEPGKVEEAEIPETVQSKEFKGSSEDKVVKPGKIEAETEIPKAVSTEEKCVPEELVKSEEKPSEDASTVETVEKGAEKAVVSKDIEPVAENEKKGADSEGKPEKTETEEKKDDTEAACEANVEKEKQVDVAAVAEPDVEKPKPGEDCKEPEPSQEAPKEEVPVKTHKQSNNILKKMKNSLIKAKKAIVGKSQTSKSSAAATEPAKE